MTSCRPFHRTSLPSFGGTLAITDRGADNFEVYCHCLLRGVDWVVRARDLKRKVRVAGQLVPLRDHLPTLPSAGTYELDVKDNAHQTARTATVEVRYGMVGMPTPHQPGRFTRECGIAFLTTNVIEVKEIAPPRGQKPLGVQKLTDTPLFTTEN